jgi:VWFA-related protein
VASGALLAFALLLPAALRAQEAGFSEHIQVERVLVDVRVVDDSGRAVLGLLPSAFRARIDGRPAPVESAFWAGWDAEGPAPEEADRAGLPPALPGRLVVLFVQRDAFQSSRITGLMEARRALRDFVDSLAPQAFVAVALYEHHLSLPLDFTTDRRRLLPLIEDVPRLSDGPPVRPAAAPSLGAGLDPEECRAAGTPEDALRLVGKALHALPGAKSLILLGWGLGEFEAGIGTRVAAGYPAARAALTDARVSVFAVDVTQADQHSLSFGLESVAEDTGGIYAKAFQNPELAFRRIAGALAGHYVLALESSGLPRGRHRIQVDLIPPAHGTVLAKPDYAE